MKVSKCLAINLVRFFKYLKSKNYITLRKEIENQTNGKYSIVPNWKNEYHEHVHNAKKFNRFTMIPTKMLSGLEKKMMLKDFPNS